MSELLMVQLRASISATLCASRTVSTRVHLPQSNRRKVRARVVS